MTNFNGHVHQEIVEKCQAGDRKAQYELYQLYSKAMFNICLRIVNDRDEAEDVLQESFISVFKNIRTYKGTATIGAWIKRIVVNSAINQVRRKHLTLVPLEDSIPEQMEDTWLPEDERSLDVGKIKQAMMHLPDGYRTVFSLYLLEGYDHQEIAQIMDITESTSKSQYNRAKRKMRELLTTSIDHEKG